MRRNAPKAFWATMVSAAENVGMLAVVNFNMPVAVAYIMKLAVLLITVCFNGLSLNFS